MQLFNRSATTVEDAFERAGNGALIVDVREAMEVRTGTPRGAVHIPMHTIDQRLASLQGKEVLVICQSGNRSGQVTSFLRSQGIDAHNIKGGIIAWRRAGLPVVAG